MERGGDSRSPAGVRRRNKQTSAYPNSLPGSRSSSPGRNVMKKRAMFEENSPSRSSNAPQNKSPNPSTELSLKNETDVIKIEGVEEFESVYNSTMKQSTKSYVSSTSFAINNSSGAIEKQKPTAQVASSHPTASAEENAKRTSELEDRSFGKRIIPDYVSAVSMQPSDVYKRRVERPARLRETGARSRRHQTLQGRISHAPNDLQATPAKKRQYLPAYIQPVASQSNAKANSALEIDAFTQKRDASQSNRPSTLDPSGKSQVKPQSNRFSRQRFASSGDSTSSEMSTNQDSLKKSNESAEAQKLELEGERPISRRRHPRRNAQEQGKGGNRSIEQSAKDVCGNKVTATGPNHLNIQQSIGVEIKKQSESKPEDKPVARRMRQRNRVKVQQPCVLEADDKYSTLPADFKPAELTNVLISSATKCDATSVKNTLPNDNRTETHLPNRNELMITNEQTSVALEDSRKKSTDAKQDIANHSVHKQSLPTNQGLDKLSSNSVHRGPPERKSQTNSAFQEKLKQAENRSKLISERSAKFEFGLAYNSKVKQESAVRNQRSKPEVKLEPGNVAFSQPMLKATKIKEDYWPRDEATEKLLNRNHSSNTLTSTSEQLNDMSGAADYSSVEQTSLVLSVLTNVDLLSASKETNLNDPVELTSPNNTSNSGNFSHKQNFAEPTALKEWNYDDLNTKLDNFSENPSDLQSNAGNEERNRDFGGGRCKKSDSDLNLPSLRNITMRGKPLFIADERAVSRASARASTNSIEHEAGKTIPSESALTNAARSWSSNSSLQSCNKTTSERKSSIVSESTALPKNGHVLLVRNSTESDEGCYVDEVNAVDPRILQANIENFNKNHSKTSGGRRRRKGSAATGQSGSDSSNSGENPNRSLSDPTHNRKKSPNQEQDEENRAIDSNFEVALKPINLQSEDVPCNVSECSDATSIQSSCLNDSQLGIDVDDSIPTSQRGSDKKRFRTVDSKDVIKAGMMRKNDSRLSLSSESSSSSNSILPEAVESLQDFPPGKGVEKTINSSGWISTGSSASDLADRPEVSSKADSPHKLVREVEDRPRKTLYQRRNSKIEMRFSFEKINASDSKFETIQDCEIENPVAKEEGEFKEVLESMNKSDNSSDVKLSNDYSSGELEAADSHESTNAQKALKRGRRPGIFQAPSLKDVLGSESVKISDTLAKDDFHRSTISLPASTPQGLLIAPKRTDGLDLRKHVVTNLLETESSYVNSLDTLVKSYMEPLKRPESVPICDPHRVEEIFFQIPQMLQHHDKFYAGVKNCHSNWDPNCKIGELFLKSFNDVTLVQSYTSFTNNYLNARLAISAACEANRSFKSFLEHCQRENKTKQSLDDLLIKPIQRMPRYELIIKDLLKHTTENHPDHEGLLAAQKKFHSLVLQMNEEKSAFEAADKTTRLLREIEHSIDNCAEISGTFGRKFIQQFFCYEGTSQKSGNKKERSLWLFSDVLLCTTAKRLSKATGRRNSLIALSDLPLFEIGCKYKYLWKFNLEGIELRGDNYLQSASEQQRKQLETDQKYLKLIEDLVSKLHCPHADLDAAIFRSREVNNQAIIEIQQQLHQMQQFSSSFPGRLDIVFPSHRESLKTIQFEFSDNVKSSFETLFWDAKSKLNMERKSTTESFSTAQNELEPNFLKSIAISKTRNGMQFSCAAPCIDSAMGNKEVWVCNTDGYVGQVCFLSLGSEPQQTQCLTVCHAKILCIAWVPTWDRKLVPTRLLLEEISKSPLGGNSRNRPPSANLATSIMAFDEDTESDEDNTSPYNGSAATSPFNTFKGNSPLNTLRPVDSLSLYNDSSSFDWGIDSDEEITLPIMSPLLPSPLICQKFKFAFNCRSHSYSCLPVQCREPRFGYGSGRESEHSTMDSGSLMRKSKDPMISGANVEGGGAYKMGMDGVTHYGSLGDLLNDGNCDLISGGQTLGNNSSMWLGTEDGKINIYLTEDALRRGSCHFQLHHSSSVQCILSHQDQVFVALGNGELIVYCRDHSNGGQWNFTKRKKVEGTCSANSITKMLVVNETELWCGCQNEVRIYDIRTLDSKGSFLVGGDNKRQIYCMASYECGIWIAMDKKSQIELFNSITHESILKVDVSRAVNKMLLNCDAIIRQHKAACLRITSLLVCKNLLWVGTSAGVVLTLNLPSISETTTHFPIGLEPQGLSYGHTGYVRFLTAVDTSEKESQTRVGRRMSMKRRSSSGSLSSRDTTLVICGGDGYEDFQKNSISDAGREDSTNHLLMWKV